MSDRTTPLLPPRVRNWKEGTTQVGLHVRSEKGSTIQAVNDDAPDYVRDAAWILLHLCFCTGCDACATARTFVDRAYKDLSARLSARQPNKETWP